MRLQKVKVTTLEADARNARRHGAVNIAAIRESLARFGQRKPLVVWGRTVIAGNGTLEAAVELGWEEIYVAKVPSDWSESQARAFALADNKTAELADWDSGVLEGLLADLGGEGWDLGALGFDLPDPGPVLDPEVLDEFDPTPPPAARTQVGDVWLLGRHRVVCGDSTDPAVVERATGGRAVDAVWTDPPYGVGYVGKTADALTIDNDMLDTPALTAFLAAALGAAYGACRVGAAWYVAAPHGPAGLAFSTVLADLDVWRHSLVWVKDILVMGRADYHYKHEPIYYGWVPGGAHLWYADRKQTTVLEFKRPTRSKEHPTMKPVALIAYCLENSTKRGDLVLDSFGGSGSTLLAAESLGRDAALIELDPRYVDVICRRWSEATGLEPTLEAP